MPHLFEEDTLVSISREPERICMTGQCDRHAWSDRCFRPLCFRNYRSNSVWQWHCLCLGFQSRP